MSHVDNEIPPDLPPLFGDDEQPDDYAPAESRQSMIRAVGADDDNRPRVLLSGDTTPIVDNIIEALAPHEVYQRGGILTDPIRDAEASPDGIKRAGSPRLRQLPAARLTEIAEDAASYWRRTADGGQRRVSAPPKYLAMVAARGQWERIRPLTGVVVYPVLRPDGTLLETSGYDPATGLLAELPQNVGVRPCPSRDDALAALDLLRDLVCDFPFAAPEHRAAWLAALLTPFARPMISSPVPMLLVDANDKGAGKTLLADLIGVIVLGQLLPRRAAPREEDEWRKAMLAIAIAADPIVLLDNITHTLRAATLDAALTGTHIKDRVLGRSEEICVQVRTMFVATANNAGVSGDLVRRTIHARIVADENPSRRTGFRHLLPDHALRHRTRYMVAALTILRAYQVAGRPTVELRPMGSYDEWSAAVRAPLVWLGEPDPAATQDELAEAADVDRGPLGAVLTAWRAAFGDRAVTAASVIAMADDHDDRSPEAEALRGALAGWLRRVDSRALGNALRGARDTPACGLRLQREPGRAGVVNWRVVEGAA